MGVIERLKQRISGAINPDSVRGSEHAAKYYESVRNKHSSYDIYKIARNTGFSFEQVSLVKGYIFYDKHALDDGVNYFWPSFEMAESWKRLSSQNGKYYDHDALLLYHELYEISLVAQGCPQNKAHDMATKKYDYRTASDLFYQKLGFKI